MYCIVCTIFVQYIRVRDTYIDPQCANNPKRENSNVLYIHHLYIYNQLFSLPGNPVSRTMEFSLSSFGCPNFFHYSLFITIFLFLFLILIFYFLFSWSLILSPPTSSSPIVRIYSIIFIHALSLQKLIKINIIKHNSWYRLLQEKRKKKKKANFFFFKFIKHFPHSLPLAYPGIEKNFS